jgi:hypothetical protein
MKIAVHLEMKDDVELIKTGISDLRTIGFDRIVICHRCSADGIDEILVRRYSGERLCELRQPGDLNSGRV